MSGGWTVPTGEVNLCLNGQTISGSITVGSGATLTLTDCANSGRVQGSGSGSGVSINGGTFNLYGGMITGFVNGVEIGSHSAIKTGSSFTMYGGTITSNEAGSGSGGGVFLIGTTNYKVTAPSFTMHGGTISDNTAGASDGGGGGIYVGEKCSFTMDGGTITGNTATAGNGGGIYIHFNAGNVSISNATITGNKASATGNTSYGHGGGIYSERGVTVKNVTITGNNSTFEGGGIYGNGTINLTDATVTDNNQYDVYYGGGEGSAPKLTVSGLVKAGYYANYAWKLPILVSGALNDDSVIRVGVREGIPLAIAEPASGVTLSAKNFKADAADCETSLGKDGKVYLVPCTHEMDDTGYTCSKCGTQFDARVGESAYYQTLTKAFDAARGNTVTLLRDVTLTENCSSSYTYSATLDLNGKTVSSEHYYIGVGDGNHPRTLTVMNSGTNSGTQPLTVKFLVHSNGTLAVDNSYTGKISRVELQAGGALERFGGEIGELALSNAAGGSTSTGYNLKLWNGNTNACTIGKFTDNNKSKSLTVKDLLGTDYAKCELYGENSGTWSVVDKSTKIAELTGYTAYKVQFPECVHQCADDSNPVCSVCHKKLYTKITAKAADGTTKTAYFTADSALEHGYVEAIQTLNGWSAAGCTEPTLTLLRNMDVFNTSMPLTGTLTLKGGTHTAKNVTVAENANVTFASGSYRGATIDGTATVKEGVTFADDATVTVNGTLNAKGGTFTGNVKFNGSSIANISGGSFNNEKKYGGVTFDYNVTGTITGGTFTFADFYTTKVKLSGGTFTTIKTNGDRRLADLLAEGAAYYGASDNQAVTNDSVNTLENVKVVSHTHNGGTDGKGICSICGKQMTASLTVGGTTSWYTAFATAIKAANAADGEKTITLYQDVDDSVYGKRTTYELTRGPVTLATGGKRVDGVDLTAKGISLTVTGSNGGFYVTVDGKDAELTVKGGDTKLAIVTAKNGGKLSLSNGTFSRVAVKDDGSSASLSGGSYGEITSDTGYVKPYALLAKGYAYKKTTDGKWVSNANIGLSKVTVEKAPFAVEKIYPNNDTNYTGSSAFATDGSITLTAVIAPETQGVTYHYWWELFNESENEWTTTFSDVNTATHTGAESKTLSISNLPENSSYQYRVHVWSDNGYQCDSEPFTVTRHQHSWTYTASGATITASCTDTTCTSPNGGSVTIAAPTELTYSGEVKPATVTASSDWQGPAASGIAISYIKTGTYGPEKLENDALPTNAGTYTASITLGEATASVGYTIKKAIPTASDFTFQAPAPSDLTYNGNPKTATVTSTKNGMGSVTVKYYQDDTLVEKPTNAGKYIVKISVEEGTNYNAADDLTVGTLVINKINYPGANTAADTVCSGQATTDKILTLPELPDGASYAASGTVGGATGLISSHSVSGTTLTYSTTKQANNASATITIPVVGATNYNDYSIVVTVTAKDKEDAGVSITTPPTSKTYGEADFTLTATKTAPDSGTWSWVSSDDTILEIVSGAATATPTIKVKKADATGATLTVTYESATHMGSDSAAITVAQKEVIVSGITAENKEYDGGTTATVNASGAIITGKETGDNLTVSVSAGSTFDSADVGSRTVTLGALTLGGASAGNYKLAASGNQTTATANITVRDLTVKPDSGQRKTFGDADPALTYAYSGEVSGETPVFDGALSREAGEDVGQYDITKGSLEPKDSGTFKAANYNLVLDTTVVTFEITKGTYGGSAPTKTVNILKNYAGVQTGTLTAADFFTTAPAEAKITNAVPNSKPSSMMSLVGADSSGNFTYDSKTNITAASDESWTVTISSKNYTDINATLTFKLVDKTDVSAQITFPTGTLTYNGAGQKYEKATTSTTAAGTPAWTYTYATADATASLDGGLPKTAGTYTVTAKYEDDAHIGTKSATLTVSKATPTGAPKYTAITTSGKTLADAGLTTTGSTLNPNAGTLVWVDNAGNVLPNTTAVAANTTYKWLFTPTDTNYTTLTGSIELYHKSSSGGGGWYYTYYTIKVTAGTNGSISPSGWTSVRDGRDQTFTITPDKGYAVAKVLVDGKSVGAVKSYTFKNVTKDHTIEAIFMKSNGNPQTGVFVDVAEGSYYEEAIDWAVEKGITNGVSSNMFAPNDPCTRAQIVTFLWRAAGSPAPKSMSSFTDVPADAFYAKAVAWAVENGITGGTGDGKFSPNSTCTRAQAVTFLYRASGSPAVNGKAEFSDVSTTAFYADAVAWAAKKGITTGIGGGLFGSDNDCTRGQIVTFLWRDMAE